MQAQPFLRYLAHGLGHMLRLTGPVLLYLVLGQVTAFAGMAVVACVLWAVPGIGVSGGAIPGGGWAGAMAVYERHILIFSMVWAAVSIAVLSRWFRREQARRGCFAAVRAMEPGTWKYWAVLGAAGCILGNRLMALAPSQLAEGYGEVARQLYAPGLAVQVLAMGVVMPCAEELVFRGLVYGNCRDFAGFPAAAAVSSLLFGWFHGNLLQGIYAFLLGFLFAWIYERGRTLLAPILAHGAANLASILLGAGPFLGGAGDGRAIACLTAASAAAGLWCLWRLAGKEEIH